MGVYLKIFIKNLLLVFFSILFTLILIEILLRLSGSTPRKTLDISTNETVTNISDSVLGWTPKIGKHNFKPWSKEGKETSLTVNKDHSRFTGHINENKSKIIFIGGSVTQGWAVNDDETFPFLIQRRNNNYKVYNYAVGGYGGYQSLLSLEKVFKDKKNIELVVYGLIPHHEVRNIAAGSWMYLLNFFSKRGVVNLPYGSVDRNNNLIRHKPIKYINLPLGELSVLITKVEKKIMKSKSLLREKKQTKISLKIINEMQKLTLRNNSKFVLLFLEEFNDNRSYQYDSFLNEKKISHVKCLMPRGKKFMVPGEGHPNELSHEIISNCIYQKLNLSNY
tara:strand:+ start:1054 stop:2058 length:1005 start_codon:yes stop_codon:yes gene_type:complete